MILASTGWLSLFFLEIMSCCVAFTCVVMVLSMVSYPCILIYLSIFWIIDACLWHAYETGLLFLYEAIISFFLVLLMVLTWMIQKVDNTYIYCLNWSRQNLKILSWLWKYGLVLFIWAKFSIWCYRFIFVLLSSQIM